MSHHRNGLLPQQVNPSNILGKVPAIPNQPGSSRILFVGESSGRSALFTEAHSTYRVAEDEGCTASDRIKSTPALLQLGVQSPTPVDWNGTSFRHWVGIQGESRTRNYISILALGWSYILSVRLLEMQGQEGAEITYTQSTAIGYKRKTGDRIAATMTIDIGRIEEDAARWWAAILAPGQGWQAIVSRSDHMVYLSPWSVCVQDDQRFRIEWSAAGSSSQGSIVSTPVSSNKALGILTGFCMLHDLGSQCFAALATTLTFPTHNHYGTIATLPFPTSVRRQAENAPANLTTHDLAKLSEELPRYMALSCNYSVIMSSLCGAFWQPEIPCNLVSPWLHPIINELPIMEEVIEFEGHYHEILAVVCAIRRPKLSTLWLGAVISGLAPKILDLVKTGAPPLDRNAFAWTGCPQSFMDLAGSGAYSQTDACGERIRRADVWRLLYLPTVVDDDLHYENHPFPRWEPFGKTSMENSAARIRIHRFCSRHHLEYQHWTWRLENGSTLVDQGLEMSPAQTLSQKVSPRSEMTQIVKLPAAEVSLDQEASRTASWEVFQWVTSNGEGVPPNEPIYKDEWVRDESDGEVPSRQHDTTESIIGRPNSSTVSCVTIDGDEAVSPKTALWITSPARQVNIENWLKDVSS